MLKWILICVLFSMKLYAETKVLAFSGSTRKDSFNKKLILETALNARQMGADVTVIDLKNYPLPFYDADLELNEKMPANATALRKLMKEASVIVIASPEYNSSLSAVLKNALDWASRSEDGGSSREAFKGKKFVLMSTSPGPGGGANSLAHLKAIIEVIGGTVMQQSFIVPNAYQAFDDQGFLKDPNLKMQLQKLIKEAI